MFSWDSFKRQVPILALAISLFFLTNVFLRPIPLAICFEGGVYWGFPFDYYTQCYSALVPGDGRLLGTPFWNPGALFIDFVVWYLAAAGLLLVYRRVRQR